MRFNLYTYAMIRYASLLMTASELATASQLAHAGDAGNSQARTALGWLIIDVLFDGRKERKKRAAR